MHLEEVGASGGLGFFVSPLAEGGWGGEGVGGSSFGKESGGAGSSTAVLRSREVLCDLKWASFRSISPHLTRITAFTRSSMPSLRLLPSCEVCARCEFIPCSSCSCRHEIYFTRGKKGK